MKRKSSKKVTEKSPKKELSVRDFYNKTASVYDHRHESHWTKKIRGRESKVVERLDGKILDFGCGTGYWLGRAGGVGLDTSREMLKRAEGKAVVLGDGNLPFKDKSFNSVLATLSVLNMCDADKALKESHRVLESRGRVGVSVSSVWENNGCREKVVAVTRHKLRIKLFALRDLVYLFHVNGFEVEYFDSLYRWVRPRWGEFKQPGFSERIKLGLERFRPKEMGSIYFGVFRKMD